MRLHPCLRSALALITAYTWRGPAWHFLRPLPHRWLRNRSGVAAIEFAIAGPLFFVVLLGMLVFGMHLGTVHSIQQLAAEAARASLPGLTENERRILAAEHVQTILPHYPLLDPAQLRVTAATSASDPNLFQVSIAYDASRSMVFAFDGLIPLPPRLITRAAVIRRGGY
jgi:Flp pilus assembly protein TadG